MFKDRKISYKLPPTTIRDKLISQEARRAKALEEQKRRRAQRVDSSRQLDLFADLKIGDSDDEEEEEPEAVNFTPASVAPYASMLEPPQPPNAISGTLRDDQEPDQQTKKKRRGKKKGKSKKPSKWADKCMYAELLEMSEDSPWSDIDGLPENLEIGWVAMGPVPVGKRCLAVTHQSSGVGGLAPNTTLRSRLLGKTLIPRFPSNLPPLTILDCILDENWRDNGILHILDVVKWKGQDICDCETAFRFWWRDTRLTELESTMIPPSYAKSRSQYQFPYPVTFMPVPYHTETTLPTLYRDIIPFARSTRSFTVDIPIPFNPPQTQNHSEDSMEVEVNILTFGTKPFTSPVTTNVRSDGLLLYVAEASYEGGTSPLSSWIPISPYEDSKINTAVEPRKDGPLGVFERLIQRRLQKKGLNIERCIPNATIEVDMT